MTLQDFAKQLDGIEYPCRIPGDLIKIARENGWVIVYGASDDLLEFEGAIADEAGVYEGGKVRFDKHGILPSFDQIEHTPEACRQWLARLDHSLVIEALWGKEPGYSWTYQLDIVHATFEVVEDGAPYCRGAVFQI